MTDQATLDIPAPDTAASAFVPTTAGALRLRNRIAMAPMTRSRAYDTNATTDMATYYAQRAEAGMIVTEGIQPSAVGQGYPATPGLHTPEQVEAWMAPLLKAGRGRA